MPRKSPMPSNRRGFPSDPQDESTPVSADAEEDDDRPYVVQNDPVAPSPIEKTKPDLAPLKKSWESLWSLKARANLFRLMLAFDVVLLLLSLLIIEGFSVVLS